MIQTGIIGGTGYTGAELVRLLIDHPQAEVAVVTSRRRAGSALADLFPGLAGRTDLVFSTSLNDPGRRAAPDVVFIAAPHGVAMSEAPDLLKGGMKVIDLSADFRINDAEEWARWYGMEHRCPALLEEAVYGLPEVYRSAIRSARLVANPGCYPTSILLGCVPLLRAKMIAPAALIADSKSGASGAGRRAEAELLFSEVDGDLKAYNASGHRHFPEILEQLEAAWGAKVEFEFTPHLAPMKRGIFSTLYFTSSADISELHEVLEAAWREEPFVRVLPAGGHPQTRAVRGTNMCHISVHKRAGSKVGKVLVVIDNLIKGASGQAIQNFNLMCGLDETAGLNASAMAP